MCTIKGFFSKWAWPLLGNLSYKKPDLNGRLRDSYPKYSVRFSLYITTIIKPKNLHFVYFYSRLKEKKKVCLSVIWIYKLETPNGGNMDYSSSVTIRLLSVYHTTHRHTHMSHSAVGCDSQIHVYDVYDGLQVVCKRKLISFKFFQISFFFCFL